MLLVRYHSWSALHSFWYQFFASFLMASIQSKVIDKYCYRDICRSFSLLKALAIYGKQYRKKPWTKLQNTYKNWSKEIKSDNFCCRKVGRAITKWIAIEKSPILLSQYWKKYQFYMVTPNISHAIIFLYININLYGKNL